MNKRYYGYMKFVKWKMQYKVSEIKELEHFDNFTDVYIDSDVLIPKWVKQITFSNGFNQDIKDINMYSVEHIIFGEKFNQNVMAVGEKEERLLDPLLGRCWASSSFAIPTK